MWQQNAAGCRSHPCVFHSNVEVSRLWQIRVFGQFLHDGCVEVLAMLDLDNGVKFWKVVPLLCHLNVLLGRDSKLMHLYSRHNASCQVGHQQYLQAWFHCHIIGMLLQSLMNASLPFLFERPISFHGLHSRWDEHNESFEVFTLRINRSICDFYLACPLCLLAHSRHTGRHKYGIAVICLRYCCDRLKLQRTHR